MANLSFDGVGIRAIYACVPENIESVSSLTNIFSAEIDSQKFTNSTGVKKRHIATGNICSSDLCYEAAKKLLAENDIPPESIDVLIFLSQTADYKMPATAPILQNRLGLSKDTACFDINLACSGYVYGLATAFSYAGNKGVNRVLFCCGETLSKLISKEDFVSYPLFGDAGSATLIEKGDWGTSYFVLGTDGNGYDAIIIEDSNGGRSPLSKDSFKPEEQFDEVVRNKLQMRMDGMKVFGFTLSAVAKNIKAVLQNIDLDFETAKSKIDYFLIHQANKLIVDTVAKKLKLPQEKVPVNVENYGNTSPVSIPLLITTNLQTDSFTRNCIMAGFGAGLSWGATYMSFKNCKVGKLLTYKEKTEE